MTLPHMGRDLIIIRGAGYRLTEPTGWNTAPLRHHQADLPITRAKILGPQ